MNLACTLLEDKPNTYKGCTCFFYSVPEKIPFLFRKFACLIFMILQKKFKVTESSLEVTDDIKDYCLRKPRPTISAPKVTTEVTFTVTAAELQATPLGSPPILQQRGPRWRPRPTGTIQNPEKALLETFCIMPRTEMRGGQEKS